jgi:hypothetical protein
MGEKGPPGGKGPPGLPGHKGPSGKQGDTVSSLKYFFFENQCYWSHFFVIIRDCQDRKEEEVGQDLRDLWVL